MKAASWALAAIALCDVLAATVWLVPIKTTGELPIMVHLGPDDVQELRLLS